MTDHLVGLRVLIMAAASELLAVCTMVGAAHLFGIGDSGVTPVFDLKVEMWLGPMIASLYVLVAAWALARRLPEGQQLKRLVLGASVGLAAACIDVLIQVASGVALDELFVASSVARIAAGAFGGLTPAWPASWPVPRR